MQAEFIIGSALGIGVGLGLDLVFALHFRSDEELKGKRDWIFTRFIPYYVGCGAVVSILRLIGSFTEKEWITGPSLIEYITGYICFLVVVTGPLMAYHLYLILRYGTALSPEHQFRELPQLLQKVAYMRIQRRSNSEIADELSISVDMVQLLFVEAIAHLTPIDKNGGVNADVDADMGSSTSDDDVDDEKMGDGNGQSSEGHAANESDSATTVKSARGQ